MCFEGHRFESEELLRHMVETLEFDHVEVAHVDVMYFYLCSDFCKKSQKTKYLASN